MHACTHTHTHTHACACMHTHSIHTHSAHTHTRTHTYTHTHAHTHILWKTVVPCMHLTSSNGKWCCFFMQRSHALIGHVLNTTVFQTNTPMHSLDKCQTVLVSDAIVPCIYLTCQTVLAFDAIVPALTFLPVWWVSRCLPSAQRSQGCSSSLCCNNKVKQHQTKNLWFPNTQLTLQDMSSDKDFFTPNHTAHLTRPVWVIK